MDGEGLLLEVKIKPPKALEFTGGFEKCKGNNCDKMINLIRNYKLDYDKKKKSFMRFHTIDLRQITEKEKRETNKYSIEQNKFPILRTYDELLKDIFNNIGNSLSDLLLKHMDLMNTVYNKEYLYNDFNIIRIHENLNYILKSLLNFDLFKNLDSSSHNYSMDGDSLFPIINYSVKEKSDNIYNITNILNFLLITFLYRL